VSRLHHVCIAPSHLLVLAFTSSRIKHFPDTFHYPTTTNMNTEFSVEVPAEANPLTEGILFHVLRSASSSDQTQVQTGTKQLQQWEKTQGFYPLLQVCIPSRMLERS
jgi:hypothetical protein